MLNFDGEFDGHGHTDAMCEHSVDVIFKGQSIGSFNIGGSKGAPGTPPPGDLILLFSCSFRPELGVGAPPRENHGPATV